MSKVLSLIVMSTNLEYKERERQRKRERRRQASEAQREKGRQRYKARHKSFFVGSGGDKMRAANNQIQGENERRVKKSEREHVRHFLH